MKIKQFLMVLVILVINPATISIFSSQYVSRQIYSVRIPKGDPYTYLNGWIDLTRIVKYPNHIHEISIIWKQLTEGNWYWTQNFAYYFLKFIVRNQPLNYYLVNYLFALLAGLVLYIYCRCLKINKNKSFLAIFIPFILPGTHGLLHYTSLDVSGLDSIFVNLLIATIFANLILLERDSIYMYGGALLILALTIWARGNSIYQIYLLITPILIIKIIQLVQINNTKIRIIKLVNFSFYLLFSLSIYRYYRTIQGEAIDSYYGPLGKVFLDFESKEYKIIEMLNFLFKANGSIITHNRNTILTTIFSMIILLIPILLARNIKSLNQTVVHRPTTIIVLILIYTYGNLFLNYLIFSGIQDRPKTVFNQSLQGGSLIIWNPTIISIALLLIFLLLKKEITYYGSFLLIVIGSLSIVLQTIINTPPKDNSEYISMKSLTEISINMEKIVEKNDAEYCSYYYESEFNSVLINYIRKLNNRSILSFNYSQIIWDQEPILEGQAEADLTLKDELSRQINECDVIFIPDKLDMWNQDNPYRIYKAPKMFSKAIADDKSLITKNKIEVSKDRFILILVKKND
jgi:hypothetical protein